MIEPTQWEYHVEHLRLTDKWSSKKFAAELAAFTGRLNALGAHGWELIEYEAVPLVGSYSTTSVNGYMHMGLFKRPKGEPPLPDSAHMPTESGWFPDPWERFEKRYYDGSAWTDDVANLSEKLQAKDPPEPSETEPVRVVASPFDESPSYPPGSWGRSGWYPDPTERFDRRHHDGREWTNRVRVGDEESIDFEPVDPQTGL